MKISVFDYMDYRSCLQDYYKLRKEHDSKFSYAAWATEMGFSNKTLLRLILQGKRQISSRTRLSFINSLGLNQIEAEYFETLIDYCQATSTTQKQTLGARLIQLQRKNFGQVQISAESGILKDVYGPIALTTLSSAPSPMKKEDLASRLSLDLERVSELLNTLLALGLAEEKEGRYVGSQKPFKVSDHFGSQSLRNYYQYWLKKSASALDLPTELRRFRSLQIALSPEEFDEITKIFNDFVLSLLSRVEKNTLDNRRLYLMNTALFPVTELF